MKSFPGRQTLSRIWGRFSLKAKVASVFILTLVILGVLNIYSVSRRHRQVMIDEFSSKGYAIAISLANSSVETLLFHDASSVQSFVDNYRSIAGVAYVYLVGSDGEIIVHTFVPSFPAGLTRENPIAKGQARSIKELRIAGVGRVLDVGVPLLYGVIGQVHVGMDLAVVSRQVRSMVMSVILQFGLALLVSIGVVFFTIRYLINPIGELVAASGRIGQGDLTVTVDAHRTDELGKLASSFNDMVGSLRTMVHGINDSQAESDVVTRRLAVVAKNIAEGVSTEEQNVKITRARMDQSRQLAEKIRQHLAELDLSVGGTHTSAEAILDAITTIMGGTSTLFESTEKAGATIHELNATIGEVSRNVESLRDVASSTASSATEMETSIRQVETKATEVATITGDLEENFKSGIESVQRTVEGMQTMKESSSRVSGLITSLTQNMQAIESILKLILDINDQTGLLALNAAILSAQAGKHGKGFAVVASEMKALQEKTQKSAKEIAVKIAAIQSGADATVRAVTETDARVDQSFALSRKAGEIILSIQSSVEEVNQRILDIVRATREQSSMGAAVSRAAQDLSAASERLASTAVEQAASSSELMRGAEQMKGVARTVNESTGEQSRGTREINERLKEMQQVTGGVGQATEQQMTLAREVLEAIEVVSSMSNRNNAMANQLGDIIANLRQRGEKLKDETNKFTL